MTETQTDIGDLAHFTAEELRERGFSMHGPPVVVLALDPAGDGEANIAMVALERELWRRGEVYDPDLQWQVRYVMRGAWAFPNGTTLPIVMSSMLAVHRALETERKNGGIKTHFFAVETNGIGWGYVTTLQDKVGNERVCPIVTTGGVNAYAYQSRNYSMPRQAGLDNLRVLMELHVWKVAKGAPGAAQVAQEMNTFVWQGSKPKADKGKLDDMVMACAIATWTASKILPLEMQLESLTDPRMIRSRSIH